MKTLDEPEILVSLDEPVYTRYMKTLDEPERLVSLDEPVYTPFQQEAVVSFNACSLFPN